MFFKKIKHNTVVTYSTSIPRYSPAHQHQQKAEIPLIVQGFPHFVKYIRFCLIGTSLIKNQYLIKDFFFCENKFLLGQYLSKVHNSYALALPIFELLQVNTLMVNSVKSVLVLSKWTMNQ